MNQKYRLDVVIRAVDDNNAFMGDAAWTVYTATESEIQAWLHDPGEYGPCEYGRRILAPMFAGAWDRIAHHGNRAGRTIQTNGWKAD